MDHQQQHDHGRPSGRPLVVDERPPGPDVMGREEAADTIGVSVRQVNNLMDRDPAFPNGTKLARGKVWDGPAIRAYKKDRGRPDPKHTKVLQSYRKTHNIAQAARTAGCAVTTARRVLVDVGLIPAQAQGQEHPPEADHG